ncbi:dipeptidase [Actinocrispum wychmicini]|nr:membrane dipeptidase [Actinocrispum wychmicini]
MSMSWRDLHSTAVVADAHNDLLCAVVARPTTEWSDYFRREWLPQLRAGGVTLQVLPVFIDETFQPEGALRQTIRMIECARQITADNADDVTLCLTATDIDEALSVGRIALVLALESAPGVGEDIELFRILHTLGVRIVSIAHFGRTALADGSGEDATGSSLTSVGVEAVALLEELGVLFDVSHLGAAGVSHVLNIATRPLIATHSSARALRDHHRNLTDEHILGIAGTGGVVCVNFFAPFLAADGATLDHVVDHIEHIVALAGVRAVGLGPDFVKQVLAETQPAWCEHAPVRLLGTSLTYLEGLEGPAGLPLVTERLVARGWAEDDIRAVLGGNVLRLFRDHFGPA